MISKMELTVENEMGEHHAIQFALRKSEVAQKWAASIIQANLESFISQRKRWYNFPSHLDSQSEVIAKKINLEIQKINQILPGKIPYEFYEECAQDCVNRLHIDFVEYEKNQEKNSQVAKSFSEINYLVHAYESSVRSQDTFKKAGIPEANILINWNEPFRQNLQENDYLDFTVAKKFGTCYLSYCQVGLHLYEMFLEKNEIVPDDQIRPLRFVSADTYIWFGSTTGPQSLARRKKDIEHWFKENREKFSRLDLHWGDPKLAIGWLPVADLIPEILSLPDQLKFLENLSKFSATRSLKVF
jgi:hypothetical protein